MVIIEQAVERAKADEAEWQKMMAQVGTEEMPPSFLRPGEIVGTPSAESPALSRVSSLQYKGYVKMWDTKTGAVNLTPHWFRWQVVKMKHEDGTQMYTFTDPHIPPNYGEDLFCPLNPSSPEFEIIKGMGFKPCHKAHIPYKDAVNAHVLKSHKRAAVALERVRQDRMRQEDREIQLALLRSNQELIQSMVTPPASGKTETPSTPRKRNLKKTKRQ